METDILHQVKKKKRAIELFFLLAAAAVLMYPIPLPAKSRQGRLVSSSYVIAPALIPGTRAEMNTAGFWISRHSFPDRIIMDQNAIREFNASVINELKISYDLSTHPQFLSGKKVRSALERDIVSLSDKRLYRADGSRVSAALMQDLRENMNLASIPFEIRARFGFAVKYADQRGLPTVAGLYMARSNRDFDRLQNSAIDMGTPLSVLHTSADGKWHYAVAPYGEGWIEGGSIAFCSLDELRKYITDPEFAVITSPKADIYLDPEMRKYHDRARMGAKFPLKKQSEETSEILIPLRTAEGNCVFTSGYVRNKDIHRGYLLYTPRNIIIQAFEFLNDPYGWGDMNGEQDCSSLLRGVFATVGIALPRNSAFQSRTGKPLARFGPETPVEQRVDILNSRAIGGITLLGMRGHIMLFLGSVDGSPYAIHGMWGYRSRLKKKEVVNVVNRIVVTDLTLGKDTRGGSFLKRLDAVRTIEK
ncbi:MAG: SH3 domain-containing protein [Syntrophales bacterium]